MSPSQCAGSNSGHWLLYVTEMLLNYVTNILRLDIIGGVALFLFCFLLYYLCDKHFLIVTVTLNLKDVADPSVAKAH